MFSFKIARFNVTVDKLLFYVIRLLDSRILKKKSNNYIKNIVMKASQYPSPRQLCTFALD